MMLSVKPVAESQKMDLASIGKPKMGEAVLGTSKEMQIGSVDVSGQTTALSITSADGAQLCVASFVAAVKVLPHIFPCDCTTKDHESWISPLPNPHQNNQ
jgi:hypothetical protein